MGEVETFHLKRKDLGTEILVDDDFAYVIAYRYWDSHGKKIFESDHPNMTWKRCHVTIEKHKYLDESANRESESWILHVNGERIFGIQAYKLRGVNLYIDAPWGWG